MPYGLLRPPHSLEPLHYLREGRPEQHGGLLPLPAAQVPASRYQYGSRELPVQEGRMSLSGVVGAYALIDDEDDCQNAPASRGCETQALHHYRSYQGHLHHGGRQADPLPLEEAPRGLLPQSGGDCS